MLCYRVRERVQKTQAMCIGWRCRMVYCSHVVMAMTGHFTCRGGSAQVEVVKVLCCRFKGQYFPP